MPKIRTPKSPSSTSAGEKLRRDFSIMTPQELAAMLEISLSSINQWRSNGEGPAYTKLGRRVYYRKQDVMTWIDEGLMVRADTASPLFIDLGAREGETPQEKHARLMGTI